MIQPNIPGAPTTCHPGKLRVPGIRGADPALWRASGTTQSGGPRQSRELAEEGGNLGEVVDRRERSQGQPGRREPSRSYCLVR